MTHGAAELTAYESVLYSRYRIRQMQDEMREIVLVTREAIFASRAVLRQADQLLAANGHMKERVSTPACAPIALPCRRFDHRT